MDAKVPFHKRNIGNFMVYQDIPVAMGVFWGFSPQTKLQATPN